MTNWMFKSLLGGSALLAGMGIIAYALAQSSSPVAAKPSINEAMPLKPYYPAQNSAVSIAVNQNGVFQRADGRGYINVNVGEVYKLEIYSPNYPSAVSVKIDGVSVMDRLVCDRQVTLERPINIAKQFIVLEEGNPGLDRDGGVNNPNLGLIEVTFVPLRRKAIAVAPPVYPRPNSSESNSRRSDVAPSAAAPNAQEADKAGLSRSANGNVPVGTGLSGDSSQQFVSTNDWEEAPEIAPTYTKKYRLVGIRPEPITLHSMGKPQPVPQPIVDSAPPRL